MNNLDYIQIISLYTFLKLSNLHIFPFSKHAHLLRWNMKTAGRSTSFSTCKMAHTSAVLACFQYGSHLVFIESKWEEDFIVAGETEDYWIGLTGSNPSEARWLDGSSTTYSNFDEYSFNENGTCFRIAFYDAWPPYSWQDKDCSKQFRFICEKISGNIKV